MRPFQEIKLTAVGNRLDAGEGEIEVLWMLPFEVSK